MKISFGICLGNNYDQVYVSNLLESIVKQDIPFDDYEIILIGNLQSMGTSIIRDYVTLNTFYYSFDETINPGWITKKKNIIARVAKFENVCIIHDYLKLSPGWFYGVEASTKLFPNWQVLINRVENLEGTRHADWIVNPRMMMNLIQIDPERYTKMLMKVAPHENGPQFVAGLPYSVNDLTHIQYVSGGFIFCKTDLLRKIPMNEHMIWGDPPGEDVEWSERLNVNNIKFVFNPYSVTTIQKPNKWYLYQMPYEFMSELRKHYGST